MIVRARNVGEAYKRGLTMLQQSGRETSSRAGRVLRAAHPVLTVYSSPRERVLLDEGRGANPFFHLLEAVWMMSGSQDATWLDDYVSDFSSRFAEGDGNQHGAYGHRWRVNWEVDQLEVAVSRLRESHYDRRTVIAMWDPSLDLIDPSWIGDAPDEMSAEPRDLPCNTHLYPLCRGEYLDLTVCCRSNDAIWGAYGSNAVHFSVLQEYLAGRLGLRTGAMYQLSNDFHAYVDVLERVGEPRPEYDWLPQQVIPIGEDWEHWLSDAERFTLAEDPRTEDYDNGWFEHTLVPMWETHLAYREDGPDIALDVVGRVGAPDWELACRRWLEARASS